MRLIIIVLTLFCISASAQTPEDEVKKPVLRLFDGMRTADSTMMRSAFAPGGILQTIAKGKEGETVVRTENVDRFIAGIAGTGGKGYDERITFELIRIDADLAIAWTPYQFFIGNKMSHCGVNSFQLVRLGGEWKIQYIIDTRRKEGCN